ncbi:LuxR C-terminal-related transcriptional regulator [Candidatus Pantoea formicae]|uniref:LuxR C-terminal-related transcriptional regulator n=1 Tax=Candidatus Pantoea formicae TaxID=2608355 RepID=UPI003ED89AD7
MYPARHFVVIGERNILHRGLFDIVDTVAHQHYLQTFHACNCARWAAAQAIHSRCHLRAAIVCLSQGTFMPEWISTLLNIKKRVNTRLVIFADDVSLLTGASVQVLQRVIHEEQIVHTRTCRHRITRLLGRVIAGEMGHDTAIQLTQRELDILDGFVHGKDAEWQSSEFGIDRCTVYQHRKNCANKLGLKKLKDLTRLRLGNGQ